MDFLNVFTIKKLAVAKGCTAERTATIKHRHFVRVTGPDGLDLQGARGVGLGLLEAKRRLEAMPNLAPGVVDRKRASGPARKAQGSAKVAAPRTPSRATKPVTRRSPSPSQ